MELIYTIKSAREATMLHLALLKYRNELDLVTANNVSMLDPITGLQDKITECGGTEYLEEEMKKDKDPSIALIYEWWKSKLSKVDKLNEDIDSFIKARLDEKTV